MLAPGDLNLTFKRYVEAPVALDIADDHIVDDRGRRGRRRLFASYLEAFDDAAAYATSHVGWGMNPGARWDYLELYDKADVNGTEARAYAGNFLYSTGANEHAGRFTRRPLRPAAAGVHAAPRRAPRRGRGRPRARADARPGGPDHGDLMATDTALPREQLLARIDELGPRFRERSSRYDREAAFPYENYDDLRDAGLLGVCIPARYGGLGASFADYMHLGARLGEYCAMTALTFNMHCQTVLWTGIVADELDLAPEDRARHEEVRTDLYRRILDRGEMMSQPLSEGVARGATAGVMTEALPVEGGWRVSGRKIFASLSGAASAYNLTVKVPGEEQVRFMSVRADNPGVRIVGDWDTLGMRGTDSRTLLFEEAFVPYADELLPAGVYDQLAERGPTST